MTAESSTTRKGLEGHLLGVTQQGRESKQCRAASKDTPKQALLVEMGRSLVLNAYTALNNGRNRAQLSLGHLNNLQY